MKKLFASMMIALMMISSSYAYELTSTDRQVVTALNTIINRTITKTPSKKSGIITLLQQVATQAQANPRAQAIIFAVLEVLKPSTPAVATGSVTSPAPMTSTGTTIQTGTVSSGTSVSTGVQVSLPGTLIPTSGRCRNNVQLRQISTFKGLFSLTGSQIFAPQFLSINAIDDNDQCLWMSTVFSGGNNELTRKVYNNDFQEVRGLSENVWSLKRVSGVFGDYFYFHPSVNELRYYGTGRATGVVSGSGNIVIDPAMYTSVQYRGDNKFTVQTSRGEVFDLLGNK